MKTRRTHRTAPKNCRPAQQTKATSRSGRRSAHPAPHGGRHRAIPGRVRVIPVAVAPIAPPEPIEMVAAPVAKSTPEPEHRDYGGDSAFRLYIREIGETKLLTPQEEIQLARRIQRGDLKAREHMIKANLRLVVKIARDYEGLGLPLLDLINEGNIGLMRGVERFNPAKGAKLSTYAALWIKQAIRRALGNQSKTIRLPVHVVDKMSKLRRT